jgi:hypothetical protein
MGLLSDHVSFLAGAPGVHPTRYRIRGRTRVACVAHSIAHTATASVNVWRAFMQSEAPWLPSLIVRVVGGGHIMSVMISCNVPTVNCSTVRAALILESVRVVKTCSAMSATATFATNA